MKYLTSALILLLLSGCSPPAQDKPQAEVAAPVFKLAGDVKHTMQWVLDPAADHIWDSAGFVITAEGTKDLSPKTDEAWLAVQHSAAIVAETGNLLLMPGRVGDEGWQDISKGLVDAGLRAQAAAAAHDADGLFDAGGQIYRVCTSCHAVYVHDEDTSPAP